MLVTHDVDAALAGADRVLALGRDGSVAFEGDSADVDPSGRGRSTPSGGERVNAPPSTCAVIATLLAKDLRVELRTLQSVPAMVLFSTTIYVIFRFGLDRTALDGALAAGVLLVTILFAALLAINRLFVAEREQGGFEAIRLAPVDGTALFFAKAAALVVYLVALEAGRAAGLLAVLPRLRRRAAAAAAGPAAAQRRARRRRGP